MTIHEAFREQAAACEAMGSPFMARLMGLAARRLRPGSPVTDRVLSWRGDASPNADNVPLRLAGALHALKMQGHALIGVYPPNVPDDGDLWSAVETAITEESERILAWLDNPPQTNEVRRAAVILPALALLEDEFRCPLELLELGTSGGLNLRADKFRLDIPGASVGPADAGVVLCPKWSGPLPPTRLPPILRRAGVDIAPLDPLDPGDQLRLLAYLWADQPDRIERTRAAFEVARAVPAESAQGDAGHWLEHELARPATGRLRVVVHTVAWQYFSEDTRRRAETAMLTANGPVARLAMEHDGGKGAGVTLTNWPGGTPRQIARADFHGRWVDWTP